jgi:hypothetical protein
MALAPVTFDEECVADGWAGGAEMNDREAGA